VNIPKKRRIPKNEKLVDDEAKEQSRGNGLDGYESVKIEE